jgi:hypothetical protein
MRSIRPLAALALLIALAPAPARAQTESDKATARELWELGQTKLTAKDFKGAENDFRRANALYHAPTLLLALARAQVGQGKFVEGWENYHTIILENVTSPPAFAAALAEAQAEIVKIEGRRAKVTINVTGADSPKVTLDETALKAETLGVLRFVDPGAHVLKATADGYKTATQSVTIPEGGSQSMSIALVRDPTAVTAVPVAPGAAAVAAGEPPSGAGGSWNKTAGFVVLGVGGAGLIEGVITGVLAMSKHSDLAKACPTGTCPGTTESSEISSYHTVAALSTLGFIVGAVGLAGGAVLVFTAPKDRGTTSRPTGLRVAPYVGFGSAGAVGSF